MAHSKDPYAVREAKKYENPIPSREFILDYLSSKNRSFTYKRLCVVFHLHLEEELEALRRRLRAMVRDGQLFKGRKGLYQVVTQTETITGRVIGHRDRYGFVAPEDGTSDIYLSPKEMRYAMDGDLVAVRVIGFDKKNRREGQIAKIIERSTQPIVGRFFIEGQLGFVEPDNARITHSIIVPRKNQFEAKPGQLVMVEIETYPTVHTPPTGKIIEVLGDFMAPGMEIEMAIRSNGVPYEWPSAVLREIKKFQQTVAEKEKLNRADLRELPFVTIDGEDAKDFDDAVYCERRQKEGWRLYVAIADVGHYVKLGSGLDIEAINRGNSVYFPGRVVPMLPHELSNGLCSLNPRVDRLAFVCEMTINAEGEVLRSRFYKAVIQSQARLTYEKVAKFLEGKNKKILDHVPELHPHIKELEHLYRALHQQRHKIGILDFEKEEVRIEFGAGRKIKRLIPVIRNKAHFIIEECMLRANICAAKFLAKNHQDGLYRVHDGPPLQKVMDLREMLGEMGLKLGGGDLPTSKDYAILLEKIKGRPDSHLLQTALLRSLSQAYYSPENEGHFGLAFEEYAHFTSPIRRYPDLTVHRAIAEVLEHQKKTHLPDFDALLKLGEHCSMTERRADDATREALSWLKCEYMMDKIGETFKGVINGVTHFGIFVELESIYVEGLVHMNSLDGDYYDYDAVHHRLMGRRTRKTYRIGDLLKVRVVQVNLEDRKIDFELV